MCDLRRLSLQQRLPILVDLRRLPLGLQQRRLLQLGDLRRFPLGLQQRRLLQQLLLGDLRRLPFQQRRMLQRVLLGRLLQQLLLGNLRRVDPGHRQRLQQTSLDKRQRMMLQRLLRGARGPMTLLLGHLRQRRRRGVALPARTRARRRGWHPKLHQGQLQKGCRRMDHLRRGSRRMDHRRAQQGVPRTACLRRSLQQPGDHHWWEWERRRRRRLCREDGPPPPTQSETIKKVSMCFGLGAQLSGEVRPPCFHAKRYSAGSSGAGRTSRFPKLQQPQPSGVRPGSPA